MHYMGFYPFIVAFGCIVRRRSRVEFRITLRKLHAGVEKRRLIAQNDKAMCLELVVEVLVLLSLLVGIQTKIHRKQVFDRGT